MDTTFQQEPKSRGSSIWKRTKTMLLIFLFLGLVSFSIGTLINDKLHALGYAALGSALGYVLADTALKKALSQSPTVKRKSDVAVATKELNDKNRGLAKDKKIIADKNKTLTENNTIIKQEYVKNRNRSVINTRKVHEVSESMAKRSVAAASRNIASLPGQAIPLIGIGLTIGVATWDIYDYCENLKDINKLNDAFGNQTDDSSQKEICGQAIPTKKEIMAEMRKDWQKAYRDAAESINKAGGKIKEIPPTMTWENIPEVPPIISWPEIKEKYHDSIEQWKEFAPFSSKN